MLVPFIICVCHSLDSTVALRSYSSPLKGLVPLFHGHLRDSNHGRHFIQISFRLVDSLSAFQSDS
jgi:hypothetical protein